MRLAGLEQLAGVQDCDAVGDLGRHAQVVGDQQEGAAKIVAQRCQQFEDLHLHGDVEGGRGFVGYDQRGVPRDGHGDHDPLQLAAGELMGVVVEPPPRIGHAHRFEESDRLLDGSGGLQELAPDVHGRVQ